MAAMMKGYSAFVKKGTAASSEIFKPTVTSHMSVEENLFDNLMKQASDVQQSVSEVEVEMTEDVTHSGAQDKSGVLGAHSLQTGVPLSAWDTPTPLSELHPPSIPPPPPQNTRQSAATDHGAQPSDKHRSVETPPTIQTLKPLPQNRTRAILVQKSNGLDESRKMDHDLSEGECSDSEEEKMES